MSTKLPNYLWPKGRSTIEPDLMPNVQDSDGNAVLFTSAKRKTTEGTVVDLGDSPNSNNGDPLRTAFAKVNNFIEATYWWDEGINQKFRDIDSELREGIFIYTDSDERVNLSLLDNSKLYFRGTPNQIEMNVTKKHSPNNPFDFDSEVNVYFQLTETVDISTLNVSERATFDSDVQVNGNLVVEDHADLKGKVHINEGLTVDSDVVLSADLRVDSDVTIKGELTVGKQTSISDDLTVTGHVQFDSDLRVSNTISVTTMKTSNGVDISFEDDVVFYEHVTFDSEVTFGAPVNFGKEVTFKDDVFFNDNAEFDSDIVVKGAVNTDVVKGESSPLVTIDEHLRVVGRSTFDSDVRVNGQMSVFQEATFFDDAMFYDNAYFDSDVMIAGNLTVNGTTTAVNSQNLEVRDNLIVLNYNQTTPFNDIGLIFTRFDSDNVSASNWNTALVWDELTDQFIFAQTQSSGILPNPTLTQQYVHIGQQVEFFDSDNDTRMIWDKDQARLSILNKDGTEAFAFDADSGQMEGNGTIDAGLF